LILKIGVCTSVSQAAIVRAAGGEFVEEHIQNLLLGERPEADFVPNREKALACGLPVPAANCFLPAAMKCVGPDVDLAGILRYADAAFSRAKQIGLGIFVFGSGGARRVPDGFSKDKAFEQFVEMLKQLGPLAQKHNVTIVVEPLNSGECNIINSVPEGAEAVRRCGHPQVWLLADIFHMMRDGQGPEDIEAHGSLLRHVHVAEKEKRTPPGVAGDDFRPYLRALKKAGYQGRIAIESSWKDFAGQCAGAIGELRRQLADAGF
jgi:sugar phosphate isomerase/epimerase